MVQLCWLLGEYLRVKSHDVVIEKLVAGGYGLARLTNGQIVFVPYTLPGEEVRISLSSTRGKIPLARVRQVVRPAIARVDPPCPYFGRCGGCQLQHCQPDQQIMFKKQIWLEQFSRTSLTLPAAEIVCYPAPQLCHYRQRIRLQVVDGEVGYFRPKSHQLLAIDQCLLACPEINTLLAELLEHPGWSLLGDLLKQLEMFFDAVSGQVVLRFYYQRKLRPRDQQVLREVADSLSLLKALLVLDPVGRISGPYPVGSDSSLNFQLGGTSPLLFTLEPGGFCQVNQGQNEVMVAQLLTWLGPAQGRQVLDLCCGLGNFSLPLAHQGFTVLGVDQQRAGIRQARRNNARNGLSCQFKRQSMAQTLAEIAQQRQYFDIIVLDPPRAGIKEEVAALAKLGAAQIVYISCDPATLLRDLQVLTKSYDMAAISLVDMFSQTAHIESMVLLQVRGSGVSPGLRCKSALTSST